jgi:hypothetical protein
MGRPPNKIKRDRQFNVGLTAREHDLLLACAARAGMRPVDYARGKLFANWRGAEREAASPLPHLDPLFLVQLSRLGNNLNQIARLMNTFHRPPPVDLGELLQKIRALIAKGAGG